MAPTAVAVAAVRGRLGYTQSQFAAPFEVSVATLRHWNVATAIRKARHWYC